MRIIRRKEPRTEAQEEMPAERERERREVTRMEEKKLAAQVRDSFNSKMQCQKKYFKVLHIVTSVSSKKGFVCQH